MDPWRNRKSVRICAAMDLIFAFLVLTIYVLRLVLENTNEDGTTKGFFRNGEKTPVTIILWVTAFLINTIQFTFAYLLFSIVKRGVNDSDCSIPRAKYWLVISNAIFVLLISKFIYFAFFDKGNNSVLKIFSLILCIGELFFKAYAMYFVKEFVDDLKASYTPPPAKVQFMSFLKSRKSRNDSLANV